jgi:hypothetical protein
MEAAALLQLIAGGETSQAQFKRNLTNATGIAQEMVAFGKVEQFNILIHRPQL